MVIKFAKHYTHTHTPFLFPYPTRKGTGTGTRTESIWKECDDDDDGCGSRWSNRTKRGLDEILGADGPHFESGVCASNQMYYIKKKKKSKWGGASIVIQGFYFLHAMQPLGPPFPNLATPCTLRQRERKQALSLSWLIKGIEG